MKWRSWADAGDSHREELVRMMSYEVGLRMIAGACENFSKGV